MTLRLVAALLLSVLTGCAGPIDLPPGRYVGILIDHEVGDAIAASYPQLDVGRAQCPFLVNLSWGMHGDCTIPIGGLPFHVTIRQGQGSFPVQLGPVDAVFVTRSEEAKAERRLRRLYDADFTVRCGGAPIRLVRDLVGCTVTGPDRLRKPIVIAPPGLPGYRAGASRIAGLPTLEQRFFGVDVAARRTGSVTLHGPDVERYIAATLRVLPDGSTREVARVVHCPPRPTVSDGAPATCAVVFRNATLPYTVRFVEGRGVVVESEYGAYDLAALTETVHRMVQRRAARTKTSMAFTISCGSGDILAFVPDAQVRCMLRTPRRSASDILVVQLLDTAGTLTVWRKHDLEALHGS